MSDGRRYPRYRNGLVRYSADADNYFCHICNRKPREVWQKHLRSLEHQFTHRFYSRSFVDNNNPFVTCKLCDEFIGHSCIAKHAVSHKLIPWYRPEDECEIFSRNFVSKGYAEYYCHVCELKFSLWYLAILHTDELQHRTLLEIKLKELNIAGDKLSFPGAFYEFMISNCIFPRSLNSLICVLCDRSTEFTTRHVVDAEHVRRERMFRSDLRVTPVCTPKFTGANSNARGKSSKEPEKVISSCEVCNCLIEEESIDEHVITSRVHRKREKRYRTLSCAPSTKKRRADNVNWVFCKVCERDVGVYNLYFHNKTTEHLENTRKSLTGSCKSEDPSTRKLMKSLINDLALNPLAKEIVALDGSNFFLCTICNCQICGRDNVIGHVRSYRHQETRQRESDLMHSIVDCIMDGRRAILTVTREKKRQIHVQEVQQLIDVAPAFRKY